MKEFKSNIEVEKIRPKRKPKVEKVEVEVKPTKKLSQKELLKKEINKILKAIESYNLILRKQNPILTRRSMMKIAKEIKKLRKLLAIQK